MPEPSAELGQHFIRSALSASDYVDRAPKEYGEHAEVSLKLYPGDWSSRQRRLKQHQFSDRTALGERNLAEEIAQGGGKVFLYYFIYLDIGEYNSEAPTLGLRLGADHGAELPYVFGLLNHWSTPVPEKRPQAASRCDGLLAELCYDSGSERRRFAQMEITRGIWEYGDEPGPERGYASSSACSTARFFASSLGRIIRSVDPVLEIEEPIAREAKYREGRLN